MAYNFILGIHLTTSRSASGFLPFGFSAKIGCTFRTSHASCAFYYILISSPFNKSNMMLLMMQLSQMLYFRYSSQQFFFKHPQCTLFV
jgi:hypothetical protein